MFEGPEKKFQRHIADYFIREHQYALLEQDEIMDTEYYFAEDHLIAFLKATQKETFESLETDYGTDARDEIEHDPDLKQLRVAFLIDEAHRSQEGKMGVAIRVPFRNPNEPDSDYGRPGKLWA